MKMKASAHALTRTMEYIKGTWLEKTSNCALSKSASPDGTETRRLARMNIFFNTSDAVSFGFKVLSKVIHNVY